MLALGFCHLSAVLLPVGALVCVFLKHTHHVIAAAAFPELPVPVLTPP